MYARLKVPPVGCYQLCFSSFRERASRNTTAWRYLFKKNGYTSKLVTTAKYGGVNWTLADRRAYTWGAMKISEKVTGLVSNAPATTAFPNAVSVGGNQVRLVLASKFTSTGCFDPANPGGTTDVGFSGPSEITNLGSSFLASGKPWLSDVTTDSTAYAYLRLPAPGRYRVCWQAAGYNWQQIPIEGDIDEDLRCNRKPPAWERYLADKQHSGAVVGSPWVAHTCKW